MDFALILHEDYELNMNREWRTGGDCAFRATIQALAVLMSMNCSGSMPAHWSILRVSDRKGSSKLIIVNGSIGLVFCIPLLR